MTLDEMAASAKAGISTEEQAAIDLQIKILSGEKIPASNAVDQVTVDRLTHLVKGLCKLSMRLTGYLEAKGVSKDEIGKLIYGGVKLEAQPYDIHEDAKAFANLVTGAAEVTLGEVTEETLKEHRQPVAALYRSINASLYRQLRQSGVSREAIRDEVLKTVKTAVAVKRDRAKRKGSTLP